MKKLVVLAAIMGIVIMGAAAYAADDPTKDWKEELSADKKAVKEAKAGIKSEGQAARAEEKAVKSEIKGAITSGDKEKARALREQLKATHASHVQDMKQEKKELKSLKKELKVDRKAARKAGK